ncbi:uncharacterized protein J8A68_004839 [[Candida] subhashii]|uniref:DH domain-containing protein n=1 Tax=[Candida] subhashii TaxID=561895 RepID=A0A8J5Q9Y4_9ASCO|nr:uncharacterized protein J8A68_004839 [[Candida] subhashii]KAG7661686.1 hypothetical protein J8A68_004839 [[Candida] subhashii]
MTISPFHKDAPSNYSLYRANDERSKVVKEIITTETEYVNCLKDIVKYQKLKSSTFLEPRFELRSYINKPMERLVEYPKLLSQLMKASHNDLSCFNALSKAKDQTENLVRHLYKLHQRIEDTHTQWLKIKPKVIWNGIDNIQGELLHFSKVLATFENIGQYLALLFGKSIIFCIEVDSRQKNGYLDKKLYHLKWFELYYEANIAIPISQISELNSSNCTVTILGKGRQRADIRFENPSTYPYEVQSPSKNKLLISNNNPTVGSVDIEKFPTGICGFKEFF